jgi:DNA-binding PucR family transcriptional regulator
MTPLAGTGGPAGVRRARSAATASAWGPAERSEGLRETARVFLRTGGSYPETADELFLHRNSVQYRSHQAEELRGRPCNDGRLDVELALLACHSLGPAILPAD